jgi:hypothetical protein
MPEDPPFASEFRCNHRVLLVVAFWWEPPHSCGGGALQRSEKAQNLTMGFSAGHLVADLEGGRQHSARRLIYDILKTSDSGKKIQ